MQHKEVLTKANTLVDEGIAPFEGVSDLLIPRQMASPNS